MNVSRDENGDIKLDSEDHSISFCFNRNVTPESEDEATRNRMITDVMGTPRSAVGSQDRTPRSGKSSTKSNDKYLIQPALDDME